MKQFFTILGFEFRYYLKNKVFIGVTLFIMLLIMVIMFFPRATDTVDRLIGTDEPVTPSASEDVPLPVMLIKSELSGDSLAGLTAAMSNAFPGYEVRAEAADEETVKSMITSGEAECAFIIPELSSYVYCVKNLSMYDMNQQIAQTVLVNLCQINAMISGGLSYEQAGEVLGITVNGSVESLGKNQMLNFFYTYIMIFALYMVILLYGQMVATNVASEKSSRAMELLITSAKPSNMMFGKVIASCLAGLFQLIAIFGSSFLFFNLNREYWDENGIVTSIFDIPINLLVYMLIFFILGFFIYAFLYGAIGSTASKVEDINTSVMPLTMLFIIAFMVVIFSMSSGSMENTAMVVCSFIPFTSPMAMFTRIAMSTVPFYEIAASIAILIASVIGVGILSAKIYRVGVLLYGTTPKIGSILKAIRKA